MKKVDTPSFFGLNGFVWFLGVVTNRHDPEQLGRVQVRIFGLHTEDTTALPEEYLPWAYPFQSVTSAAKEEIGASPTGILEGSVVLGFFLDGEDCQQPAILGTYAGAPGGVNDIAQLARGINTILKQETVGIEPASPYGAEYPYNKVLVSESGHVIEVDDTSGAERIHIYHRSGTYDEIDADGNRVKKTINNDYEITVQDRNMFVQGDMNIYVKGNVNIEAYNDVNLNVAGRLNGSVGEDIRLKSDSKIILEASTIDLKGAVRADSVDAGVVKGGTVHAGALRSPEPSGSPDSPDFPSETGLESPNPRDISVYVPSIEDRHAFENDDTGDGVQSLIDNGILSEDEVNNNANEGRSETTANNVPASNTICGITIAAGQNLDNIRLTPKYTVGQLSSFAAASRHRVRAQGGLTEGDIVCNLKLVAENCLDRIKAQYPTMIVTSGFRAPASRSQHTKGQAADIQFTDLNALGAGNTQRSAYYDRCVWIKNNIPFDQLIMEYKTFGTGFPWIHISFKKESLRREMLTMNNNRTVGAGIRELLL